MRLLHLKNAAVNVIRDMEKNHTMAFAAALSYYFVIALFPFLIFLSAIVAHLPLPDFFSQVMGLIARVVPAASMGPLRNLIAETILSRHSRLLTFGILFTLWSASSGLTALIDALNTPYDVSETRRYWKTRGLAIVLTFSVSFAFFGVNERHGYVAPAIRISFRLATTRHFTAGNFASVHRGSSKSIIG